MTYDTSVLVERFMPEGRLRRLPSKATKREVLLDHLAQLFAPGERYTEAQVNDVLAAVTEGGETDHVALRRYLVDYRLLAREAGVYWRTAGAADGS